MNNQQHGVLSQFHSPGEKLKTRTHVAHNRIRARTVFWRIDVKCAMDVVRTTRRRQVWLLSFIVAAGFFTAPTGHRVQLIRLRSLTGRIMDLTHSKPERSPTMN